VDLRRQTPGRSAAGSALAAALLTLAAACAPPPGPATGKRASAETPEAPRVTLSRDCHAAGWSAAANINHSSLKSLPWRPFGRDEIGWRIYAPLIGREIGVDCPPQSTGFARALAQWQQRHGYAPDEAKAAALTLLPDILHYDRTMPAHYPNGRVMTDDVFSTRMIFMTHGRANPQGVKPHDDLMDVFPFLGNPHPAPA